jgi:hypothetical protein
MIDLVAVLAVLCLVSTATDAATGDPEGWSLRTDYSAPRAFLVFAPMEDGARVFQFDCVPGNSFIVRSDDAPEELVGKPAALLLQSGQLTYAITGEIAKDANTNEVFFIAFRAMPA